MIPIDLEKALLDPASVFAEPEHVLGDAMLPDEQKVEILRRWQYNAAEESVALEEGMPGDENDDLMHRILVALSELIGPIDVDHTAPSKQHGLFQGSVRDPFPTTSGAKP
ncbi:MAG: hypothetical protein AAAB35_27705 [Phyllobacterium sp.]|uniref:hypothetical protein n=1 Tax=Phyllobacterium sp. TaxID=1871046 RepID=UPI0030F0C483